MPLTFWYLGGCTSPCRCGQIMGINALRLPAVRLAPPPHHESCGSA
jgi:hypothetical protein